MDKKYVDSVHPKVLRELRDYVSLCFEKVLAPQTHTERMHSLHVESVLALIDGRIHEMKQRVLALINEQVNEQASE